MIVESLQDKKRFPAYATDRLSALEDISIYTYEEDRPLSEIFQAIYDKESGKNCISHKESANKLSAYLLEVEPEYDQERVYPSDIKKIFQWYNLLLNAGELKVEEPVKEEKKEKPEAPEAKKEAAPKKETAKKKPAAKKASPKKAAEKK